MAAAFSRVRTVNTELDRVQQNVGAALDPVVQALASTPLLGGSAPSWQACNTANGWLRTNDQPVHPLEFHRDALGYVHLRGWVFNNTAGGKLSSITSGGGPGTASAVIGTLPAGYKPANVMIFCVPGRAGGVLAAAFVAVGATGDIFPVANVVAAAAVIVDGVSFLAEQ